MDRNGTRHALTDMSHDYRAAVLELLQRTAQRLWIDYHAALLHRLVSDVVEHGRVPGELLADQFDVVPTHRRAPHSWLASTPLVRALQRHQQRS